MHNQLMFKQIQQILRKRKWKCVGAQLFWERHLLFHEQEQWQVNLPLFYHPKQL